MLTAMLRLKNGKFEIKMGVLTPKKIKKGWSKF